MDQKLLSNRANAEAVEPLNSYQYQMNKIQHFPSEVSEVGSRGFGAWLNFLSVRKKSCIPTPPSGNQNPLYQKKKKKSINFFFFP